MNAFDASGDLVLGAMQDVHLSQVLAIEQTLYSHPWTLRQFQDALRAAYATWVLCKPSHEVVAYMLAMNGVEETHLLNIAVAKSQQKRGLARRLLHELVLWSCAMQAKRVLLEVRVSNTRARSIYEQQGFSVLAFRKNYYPIHVHAREDACVMQLDLGAGREPLHLSDTTS